MGRRTYLIQKEDDGDVSYLNYAYRRSYKFGSLEMAWTTDDLEHADLVCDACCTNGRTHAYEEFSVISTADIE